eukprot:gene8621-568_t
MSRFVGINSTSLRPTTPTLIPNSRTEIIQKPTFWAKKISFEDFFATPKGQGILYQVDSETMKKYKQLQLYLDIKEGGDKFSIELKQFRQQMNDKNLKFDKPQKLLDSLEELQSRLEEIYEKKLQTKEGKGLMQSFLFWWYGFDIVEYNSENEEMPLNPTENNFFVLFSRTPMTVVSELIDELKCILEEKEFWIPQFSDSSTEETQTNYILITDFSTKKEWSIFKDKTTELMNLNLNLLSKEEKVPFFINLYNLLYFDIFITTNSISEYNIRNNDKYPLNMFYIVDQNKFNLKSILKNIPTKGLFSLCDCTLSSPKLQLYKNISQVNLQAEKYLEDNVKITTDEIEIPFLFSKFGGRFEMEEKSSLNFAVIKYLTRELGYPFRNPKVKYIYPEFNIINCINLNSMFQINDNNFYFNKEKTFGVQISSDFQYFGGLKYGNKNGKGLLIEKDSVFYGNFRNDKKEGEGALNVNNVIIQGLWKSDKPDKISMKNGKFKIDRLPFNEIFQNNQIDFNFNDLSKVQKILESKQEDKKFIFDFISIFFSSEKNDSVFQFRKYLKWMDEKYQKIERIELFHMNLLKDIHSFCDFCYGYFCSLVNKEKVILKGHKIESLVKSTISSVVLSQFYDQLFSLYKQEVTPVSFILNLKKYRNEDVLMTQRLLLFLDAEKESFDKKMKKLSKFDKIVDCFSKIPKEKSILTKQQHIRDGYQEILSINVDGGADLSLPCFAYCLIKAEIPYLYSEFKLLFDFTQDFEIAMGVIKEMNFFVKNKDNEFDNTANYVKKFQEFLRLNRKYFVEFSVLNEILIEIGKKVPNLKPGEKLHLKNPLHPNPIVSKGLKILNLTMKDDTTKSEDSKDLIYHVIEFNPMYQSDFYLKMSLLVIEMIEMKNSLKVDSNKKTFSVDDHIMEIRKSKSESLEDFHILDISNAKSTQELTDLEEKLLKTGDRDSKETKMTLAKIYWKINKIDQCLEICQKGLQIERKNVLFLYLEAKCYLLKKVKIEEAKINLFSCLYYDTDENELFWTQECKKYFGEDFEIEYGIFCSEKQIQSLSFRKI